MGSIRSTDVPAHGSLGSHLGESATVSAFSSLVDPARRNSVLTGGAIGGAAGGTLGAALAMAIFGSKKRGYLKPALIGAGVGGLTGAGVGAAGVIGKQMVDDFDKDTKNKLVRSYLQSSTFDIVPEEFKRISRNPMEADAYTEAYNMYQKNKKAWFSK